MSYDCNRDSSNRKKIKDVCSQASLQRGVHTREANGWIEDVDLEGAPEVADNDLVNGEVCLVELGLRPQVHVSGGLTQTGGASGEDVWRGRLGEEDQH